MWTEVMTCRFELGNQFFERWISVEFPGKKKRRFRLLLRKRLNNRMTAFSKFVTCKYDCQLFNSGIAAADGAFFNGQFFFFTGFTCSDSLAANK